MKIIDAYCSRGQGGFFYDDQMAIRLGAKSDGFIYKGEIKTKGFQSIRQRSESISIILELDDGQIAIGDCVSVQYSGAGGRDPLFIADTYYNFINDEVLPKIIGRNFTSFREAAEECDNMNDKSSGRRIHAAIRYGLTGALLDAFAKYKHITMAEVVAKEYGTKISKDIIPIYVQSGDSRYENVDKMILKDVDVLPHGLINNVEEKLGNKGEKLLEYIQWILNRIKELRPGEEYSPILHFDTYGTIGLAFGSDNYKDICEYFKKVQNIAGDHKVRIEFPIDGGSKEKTIKYVSELTKFMKKEDIKIDIVNDEWCNTIEDMRDFINANAGNIIHIKTPDLGGINNAIEAVLLCNKYGFGAFLGGSCTETDISARISANIALATCPIQAIAKPGMGVDEGLMILYNEMSRVLTISNRRTSH